MVITCDDLIFNDFRMKDFLLISGNGSDGEIDDTENMSLTPTITSVFVGDNAHSTFTSQKYDSANEFTVKFARSYCNGSENDYFTENELRHYNRLLTGKPGYSWLKLVNNQSMETDFYYRAMVSKIEYERLGIHVVGFDVTFQTDGGRAYSEEQTVDISATADTPFYVFNNSDDLWDYLLPKVEITLSTSGTLTLKNITDDWESEVTDCTAGEILTMDSSKNLLTSSVSRRFILNDFNLRWIRLRPGKNEFTCNQNATLKFTFRAARKVGYVS